MAEPQNPTEVVRIGYDALSYLYRANDEVPGNHDDWLRSLLARLAPASRVLDLGCGCGIPVSRRLADAGHLVTGIDVSGVQVDRARSLVPAATFRRADMTAVAFDEGGFDAIVCLYAIIHVPVREQPALLSRIESWLAPGGVLLMTAGWREWTGSEDSWLGGDATMWWSHADVDTYRRWLGDAGLSIESSDFVPEGDGGHSLFWAVKGERRLRS